MNEAISGEQLFDDLTKRIKNIASKMDLILFSVPRTKNETKELAEDVVTLQCFHLAVYREPSAVLEKFLDRLAQIQTTEQTKSKKQTASFFTPPFIAEYIVQATIGPMVDKLFKGRKPMKAETKIKRILCLRICDPAVGGGIFLVCAHDFLMTKILEAKPDADLKDMSPRAAKCLFGVDINPESVEGCKLALHLNIAKWSLKKQIHEFANIVGQTSSSPNDSNDNIEKQYSAQEPARENTSTTKTTQTSDLKRIAKHAVWPFAWRTGIRQNAFAQQNAPPGQGLVHPMRLTKEQKTNSSAWLAILPIGSGLSQKLKVTDLSMALIGETSFRSSCFRWLKVRQQSLSMFFIEPFATNTSAVLLDHTTRSRFSAAMNCLKQFATIGAQCLNTSSRNILPILGGSPLKTNTNSHACISLASTRAKSLSTSGGLVGESWASFGKGLVLRAELKNCEVPA